MVYVSYDGLPLAWAFPLEMHNTFAKKRKQQVLRSNNNYKHRQRIINFTKSAFSSMNDLIKSTKN